MRMTLKLKQLLENCFEKRRCGKDVVRKTLQERRCEIYVEKVVLKKNVRKTFLEGHHEKVVVRKTLQKRRCEKTL